VNIVYVLYRCETNLKMSNDYMNKLVKVHFQLVKLLVEHNTEIEKYHQTRLLGGVLKSN